MFNYTTDDGAILQLDAQAAQKYIDGTRLDVAEVDALAATIRETTDDDALLTIINGTLTKVDAQLRKEGHADGVKGLCLLDQLKAITREALVCGYEQALEDVLAVQQETAMAMACS